MGLTNSVEEINDSDIKITNEGDYNSWEDITKDLTDEKIDTILNKVEEYEQVLDSKSEDADEDSNEELRTQVTKFVDEIIQKAVDDYDELKKKEIEEKFFRIPSTDDLYERSLEKHFETNYEYHDEMRPLKESSEGEDYNEDDYSEDYESEDYDSDNRISSCGRTLNNLYEACIEFCDEMNGYYDDYSEDEELSLSEHFNNWMDNPDMIELMDNIYSIKTSYNLVRDHMIQFLINNKKTLTTGMYGAIFYYVFFSKGA